MLLEMVFAENNKLLQHNDQYKLFDYHFIIFWKLNFEVFNSDTLLLFLLLHKIYFELQ